MCGKPKVGRGLKKSRERKEVILGDHNIIKTTLENLVF